MLIEFSKSMRYARMIVIIILLLLLIDNASFQTPDNNEDLTDIQLVYGDIILTEEQQSFIETSADDPSKTQNAVLKFLTNTWREGVIPYELDSSLRHSAVVAIGDAMVDYETMTCIRFRERTANDEDFIRFYRGYGCSSKIGRIGGQQNISIGDGCDKKGVVIHEIFHALGRWHEHSRPDREDYIIINNENIKQGFESNFEKVSPTFATTQGVPYDFDSVMHYTSTAFSRNEDPTIEPKNPSIDLDRLGQREGFSINDVHHVRALYCAENSTGEWSAWGSWSACSRTCNGGNQKRKRGCVGDTTCQGTNIEKRECNIEECPIPAVWGVWSSWSGCTSSCGGGRRSRVRSCLNGNTCYGPTREYENCNELSCPDPPTWNSWSSWSECSQTCQTGFRYRIRYCQNGHNADCPGSSQEEESCNSDMTCEEWTMCTKSCGGGLQSRNHSNGIELRSCNEQPCHNELCLQGLTHIGCYKLPIDGELEFLENSEEILADNPLNRTDPIRKCGQVALENKYKYFAVALGLCYSGSNALAEYTSGGHSQICTNGTGNYFGSFSVDVYHILDSEKFKKSSAGIDSCGSDYCMNTTLDVTCEDILYSSSMSMFASYRFYLALLIIITIYIVEYL